jgi:ATP nucleosidase Cap17-like, N-terminal
MSDLNAGRHRIFGEYIQIAGSASKLCNIEVVRYAHDLIRRITTETLHNGGGLVSFVGKEPIQNTDIPDSPAIIFNWTILETANSLIAQGPLPWPQSRPPLVVVTSERAQQEIPEQRRALWERLLKSGFLRVEYIQPGARSGAMLREKQAHFGRVLVCIGGGTGVEHLAQLYLSRHRSVIPLDLPIGSSREDGTGGSERLNRYACANPRAFFRLRPGLEESGSTFLVAMATKRGMQNARTVVAGVMELIDALDNPHAFFVRLLNNSAEEFPLVEHYFRDVVDPVVQGLGYRVLEMGTSRMEHAFVNVEIFERLHYSDLVVADVTGQRPNCFIELGYALGAGIPVVVTAQQGTVLPFDQSAIPTLFWSIKATKESNQQQLLKFIEKNLDRPSIVNAAIC